MPEPLFSDSWYRVKALTPRLRAHTEIGRQRYRGEVWFVLHDRAAHRFHRFSPAAHAVLALMDGQRSVEQIWQLAATALGDDAPTQGELIQLLAQLHAADVMQCDVTPDVSELFERGEKQRSQKRKSRWMSPFAIQVPLFDPEPLLERTAPYMRPLFGWLGALIWLAVVTPALVMVGLHWEDLTHNLLDRLIAPRNLLLVWLIFPVIKILHELGHAYATKIFGGEVHDMGVMLLVFTPVPYVDASASWALPNKYQRALVGAGGMLVELFIASLAFYIWNAAEPGVVRSLAYNALVLAGATTLLFNSNPLLRFDGYYIFSDLVEIPNLRTRSSRYLGFLLERHVLGSADVPEPHTAPGEPAWLVAYAVAAFVYRLFVVAAILLWILDWNFAVGALLGAVAIVGWFCVPLYRVASHLFTAPSLERVRRRALGITGAGLGVLLLGVSGVPMPLRTRAEGVVWIPENSFVRAGSDGFLVDVVATPGSLVGLGDLLVRMRDPVVETDLAIARGIVRELEARYFAERKRDQVAAQIAEEELGQARRKLARVEERHADLEVHSAASGSFVIPRSDQLEGRFVRHGQVLAYVVDLSTVSVRAVVPQDDIDLVRTRSTGVEVRLANRISEAYPARVTRIVPAASEELPSPALGSQGGGEVAVDPTQPQGKRAVQSMFEVELELPDTSGVVAAGGRVYVRFDHGYEPLLSQWYRRARQLFLSRFDV